MIAVCSRQVGAVVMVLPCLPRAQTTVIDEDREFGEQYFEMPDEEMDVNRLSPLAAAHRAEPRDDGRQEAVHGRHRRAHQLRV